MTDLKPLSPIDRINNMNMSQKRTHVEDMRKTIYSEYMNVLQVFSQNIAHIQTPYNLIYLQYPFFYFYQKDPKKQDSPICTIESFRYGSQYKSHIITRKTFSSFLQNQCMLPQLSDDIVDPMFHALDQFIRTFPRNSIETLLEVVKHYNPMLAAFLTVSNAMCLSREGNLYVNCAVIPRAYTPYLSESFQSALDLQWPNVPDKLLYKVFKVLTQELSLSANGYIDNEATGCNHTVVFGTNTDGAGFISARYQPNSDSFEVTMCDWANFQLKHFPLRIHFSGELVSDTLCSFFHALCGDSTAVVDTLSCFVSRAMDPVLPGMTIIYTKHYQEQLLTILSKLFQDVQVSLDFRSRKDGAAALPSLNQLAKISVLKKLFVAQSNSKSVIFIRDLAASEGNLRVLKKLLKGTKITLRSSYLPPQYYYNTLHMICVSNNLNRVKAIQKQFKSVNLVDLSICEREGELPELSSHDYNWLCSTFLLYGLKLRTLIKEQRSDPASRTMLEPLPNLTSEIEKFLDSCKRREGLHCDTFRLYDSFVEFYKSRHCGSEPATTKIKFNKAARSIIDMHYGKAVIYHKIRTSHMVGWYYDGLDLPDNPPLPSREHPSKLLEHLSHINTYALSNYFDPVLDVRIVRPLPDEKD